MQHPQHCFRTNWCRALIAACVVLQADFGLAAAEPHAHDISQDACQSGPDYVAGIDTSGNAVAPADAEAAKAAVPPEIVVPLANRRRGRDGGYVVLDGKALEPLLNPPPCN